MLATRKKPGGKGVMIGVVDEADADPAQTIHYVGRKAPDKRRLDD